MFSFTAAKYIEIEKQDRQMISGSHLWSWWPSYFGQVSKIQIIVPAFKTHGIETIGEQMKKASFALEAVSRK